jgi:hypothetical protein
MTSDGYALALCRTALADRSGIAVMLRVFMDESGTHDTSPVITVAAYTGRPSDWRKFTRDWNRMKDPIKVFHSTDCEALRGEFSGWTQESRNELVARLLPVIAKYELRGTAVGINITDFNNAVSNQVTLSHLFGSPYVVCFQAVVDNIMWQMQQFRMDNVPLAFIHEENDYQQQALEAFEFVKSMRTRHTAAMTITFAAKNEMVPLQAADVLAYETNKRARDQTRPIRRSLTAMDPNGDRIHTGIFDKTNVNEMLRKIKLTYDEVRLLGRPTSLFD